MFKETMNTPTPESSESNVPEVPELPAEQRNCQHYWVIAPPNGPQSDGICKLCGLSKRFQNSYEYSFWHSLKSGNYVNNMGRKKKEQPDKS